MSNDAKKLSELNVITTGSLSANDRVLVMHYAGSNLTTVTATVNSVVSSFYSTMPGPYDTDAAAATAGIALKSLYYDSTGKVHIRII